MSGPQPSEFEAVPPLPHRLGGVAPSATRAVHYSATKGGPINIGPETPALSDMPPSSRHAPPSVRNPFVIGHHAEGAGFCDRRSEVDRIANTLVDPSARLLVYGERRLGKSSTIHEAARHVRKRGHPVIIVDLAVATTASAAAQRILTALHRELGHRWRDRASRLLARLRPGAFSMQASTDATGQPSVTFQVSPSVSPQDPLLITDVLDAVEAELETRRITIGLCLDEFQRLGRWYGADVAWQLKEMLERHRRIAYVLAGSERTLVEQMLEDKKAGLWKVVDVLDMQPVPPGEMAQWIADRSKATGVAIDIIVAAAIVRMAGPRTRDIVQLARATWDWSRSNGNAVRDAADYAMNDLVIEQGAVHQRQWDGLTDVARGIAATLARNPDVQLLASKTLTEFGLGPKSTVKSALDDMVAREVLSRNVKAGGAYAFDDPFFQHWVRSNPASE